MRRFSEERSAFRALAGELGVLFFLFDLHASPDTLRRRITSREASREEPSDATLAVLEHQFRNREPLADDETTGTIVIDAEVPFDQRTVAQSCRAASCIEDRRCSVMNQSAPLLLTVQAAGSERSRCVVGVRWGKRNRADLNFIYAGTILWRLPGLSHKSAKTWIPVSHHRTKQ